MSLWQKMKKLAKDHIEENRAFKAELADLSDKQLHQKAMREGGKYADAYVERKRKARQLSERIKQR